MVNDADESHVEALDALAAMGESETYTRERLINLVAAAVLHKLGETHIEITAEDLEQISRDYSIQADQAPGGAAISIRIYRKPDDQQGALALEVTSPEKS